MAWENLAMKTTKLFLGLSSTLLFAVGLTKAAEITDPLAARLGNQANVKNETTSFCIPTNWADSDR